jgi:hypothetical protein
MKIGTEWKKKPVFYYICNIDDLEFNSRNIVSATLEIDEPFNTWDTIFQENEMGVDVEEERETSEITIKIIEEEKTGLLGLKTSQVKKDEIQITYDYRTGRWNGDDSLMDEDGYGHYLGQNYEIWFNIYQTDYDGDYIPYWTEVNVIGTNPRVDDTNLDPDMDGVPTFWEWRWGYNPTIWDDHIDLDPDIDGVENIEEYQISKWFSDPFSRDIYIEADGMEKGGLFDPPHILLEETKQFLIERFARQGINVYIDDGWPGGPINGGGELLTHHKALSYSLGTFLQYYNNHFSDDRKGIFRYFIVAHSSGFTTATKFNRYDCFSVDDGREIMWSLKRHAYTQRLYRLCQASTIMHELGHSLGILPWTIEGCDNLTFAQGRDAMNQFLDTWGDYESVMNYYYIYKYRIVDYSDGSNGPPYDQNDWEELYLPTFQYEDIVVADPTMKPPAKEYIVIEKTDFELEGWNYSMNLTKQFLSDYSNWSPIYPLNCNYVIYLKEEDSISLSDRNLRLYGQPIFNSTLFMPSIWTLICEGYLDEEGNIDLV